MKNAGCARLFSFFNLGHYRVKNAERAPLDSLLSLISPRVGTLILSETIIFAVVAEQPLRDPKPNPKYMSTAALGRED